MDVAKRESLYASMIDVQQFQHQASRKQGWKKSDLKRRVGVRESEYSRRSHRKVPHLRSQLNWGKITFFIPVCRWTSVDLHGALLNDGNF